MKTNYNPLPEQENGETLARVDRETLLARGEYGERLSRMKKNRRKQHES